MVAFYLPGGLPVYAFSLLMGLGAATGLAWMTWQAGPGTSNLQALRRFNGGLWVCLGALLGGRVSFVAVNWPYYRLHLFETVQVFQGGLAWAGALAGGLLALALYALFTAQALGALADACLPLLASLSVSAYLGCWLDGVAFGPVVSWGLPARDEWGQVLPRWPLQLGGALLTAGLFWLLSLDWNRRLRPGQLAAIALLGLALQLLALALLRADPAPFWNELPLDAWAALALAVGGILAFLGSFLGLET